MDFRTDTSDFIGILIGSPIIGGTDKRVLFDDSGVVGKDAGFTWDKSTNTLAATNIDGTITTATQAQINHDSLLNFTQTEHFTKSSINHSDIGQIGTNSHSAIDAHLALQNAHIDWTNADENLNTSEDIEASAFHWASGTSTRVLFLSGDEIVDDAGLTYASGTNSLRVGTEVRVGASADGNFRTSTPTAIGGDYLDVSGAGLTRILLQGTVPVLTFTDTNGPVDQKIFVMAGFSDSLRMQSALDNVGLNKVMVDFFLSTGETTWREDMTLNKSIFVGGDIEIDGILNHGGSELAFYGVDTVTQPSHIVDADGTLADITTKFNILLAQGATLGLQASS